jgi:hypothetical protein
MRHSWSVVTTFLLCLFAGEQTRCGRAGVLGRMITVTSFGTHRRRWTVFTAGFAAAGFYDLVCQPRHSRQPESDVMDLLDLAYRQVEAAEPFARGQVTAVHGAIVRLVPVASPRWRRRLYRVHGHADRVLRVVPA